jgi:hypothetical protein
MVLVVLVALVALAVLATDLLLLPAGAVARCCRRAPGQ